MKKLKRGWVIAIAIAIVIVVGGGMFLFRRITQKGTLANENYLASNFLEIGLYEKGRNIAQQALEISSNDISRQLVALSFCYEEDFKNAGFYSGQYLAKHQDPIMEEISQYAARGMESGADLVTLIRLHNKVKEQISVPANQEEKLMAASEILEMDTFNGYDIQVLEENMDKLYNANDVVSLKAKAYGSALQGNTQDAAEYAIQVAEKEDTIPNQMAAANAVAASYLQSEESTQDPEIQALQEELGKVSEELDELKRRHADAEAAGRSARDIEKKLEEKQFEARQLYDQIENIPLQRAINYMEAKKTGGDSAGYKLQIARLSYLMGEHDDAEELIYDVLGEAVKGTHDGYLAPETVRLLEAYDYQPSETDTEAEWEARSLDGAARMLEQGLTLGYVGEYDSYYYNPYESYDSYEDYEMPQSFSDFLVQVVQDYRELMHISYVDARKYPQVDVHLTTILSDEEMQALKKEDFLVFEQRVSITDFELIRNEAEESMISVCLVMDVSGSMDGGPLEDAKRAAASFLSTAQGNIEVGLVKFSDMGEAVAGLTESTGVLSKGINSLMSEGGTNIADGLRVGIDVLSGCKGSPVIILLSDGADGGSAMIEDVKKQLSTRGIKVYSIGVGGADEAYLKGISDVSGGKYIRAEDSMELGAIYRQIRQYIYNDYILRLTVLEDVDTWERDVQIQFREEAYDEEDYVVGVPEEDILEEEEKGILTDFYREIGGSKKGVPVNEQ